MSIGGIIGVFRPGLILVGYVPHRSLPRATAESIAQAPGRGKSGVSGRFFRGGTGLRVPEGIWPGSPRGVEPLDTGPPAASAPRAMPATLRSCTEVSADPAVTCGRCCRFVKRRPFRGRISKYYGPRQGVQEHLRITSDTLEVGRCLGRFSAWMYLHTDGRTGRKPRLFRPGEGPGAFCCLTEPQTCRGGGPLFP